MLRRAGQWNRTMEPCGEPPTLPRRQACNIARRRTVTESIHATGHGEATRATAHLPGLDVEIVHRMSPDGSAEHISINLVGVPSFRAFGRFLEAANPVAFWMQAAQMAWAPWFGAVNAAKATLLRGVDAPRIEARRSDMPSVDAPVTETAPADAPSVDERRAETPAAEAPREEPSPARKPVSAARRSRGRARTPSA
jgi:hypothetical protein